MHTDPNFPESISDSIKISFSYAFPLFQFHTNHFRSYHIGQMDTDKFGSQFIQIIFHALRFKISFRYRLLIGIINGIGYRMYGQNRQYIFFLLVLQADTRRRQNIRFGSAKDFDDKFLGTSTLVRLVGCRYFDGPFLAAAYLQFFCGFQLITFNGKRNLDVIMQNGTIGTSN